MSGTEPFGQDGARDAARTDAVAAFLAWPGPRRSGRASPGRQLRAALVTLALGMALSVCSMLAPLAGAPVGAWSAGAGGHLLLFCHLSI